MPLGEMKVVSVFDEETQSGWYEPMYDPEWSDLTKLRWHASIAALNDGIHISIQHGTSSTNGVMDIGQYSLSAPGMGIGSMDYETCVNYIQAMSWGWDARKFSERRRTEVDEFLDERKKRDGS